MPSGTHYISAYTVRSGTATLYRVYFFYQYFVPIGTFFEGLQQNLATACSSTINDIGECTRDNLNGEALDEVKCTLFCESLNPEGLDAVNHGHHINHKNHSSDNEVVAPTLFLPHFPTKTISVAQKAAYVAETNNRGSYS